MKKKKEQEERERVVVVRGWGGNQSKLRSAPPSCQRPAQRLVIAPFEMTMA